METCGVERAEQLLLINGVLTRTTIHIINAHSFFFLRGMLKKLASVSCVVLAFVAFCFPVFSVLPSVLPVLPDIGLGLTLELPQRARTRTSLPKPSNMACDDDEFVGGSIGGLSSGLAPVLLRGLSLGFVGFCADFERSGSTANTDTFAAGATSPAGVAVVVATLPAYVAAIVAACLRCFLPAKWLGMLLAPTSRRHTAQNPGRLDPDTIAMSDSASWAICRISKLSEAESFCFFGMWDCAGPGLLAPTESVSGRGANLCAMASATFSCDASASDA